MADTNPQWMEFSQWVHENAPPTGSGLYEYHADGGSPQQYLATLEAQLKRNPNSNDAKALGEFVNRLKTDPVATKYIGSSGLSSPQNADPGQVGGAPFDRQQAINDYYKMMTDPNSPQLKAAQMSAMNNARESNAARGLGGGLAEASATKVGLDAYNASALQRGQSGMTALLGGMGELRGSQGQIFDQNQSNQINTQNAQNNAMKAGVSAAGQIGSAAADYAKSTPSGSDTSGGGMTSSYPASSPDEWSSYPSGGGL